MKVVILRNLSSKINSSNRKIYGPLFIKFIVDYSISIHLILFTEISNLLTSFLISLEAPKLLILALQSLQISPSKISASAVPST
jgi:hypothetical protein